MGNLNSSVDLMMNDPDQYQDVDTVVQSVIHKFIDRAKFGKKKYGTTLDREDLTTKDWIQHTQEELMDAILYLEKLKRVHA